MERILVQIASYRDWELTNTIESALGQASHPDRLRFAVLMQDDLDKFALLNEYRNDSRFKIEFQHWREARGVGLARNITDQMYDKEEFFFQIDAHMRFTEGWDDALISEWKSVGDSKAILSSYPPAYRYNKVGEEEYVASNPNRLVVHDMFLDSIPVFFGQAIPNPTIGSRGAFVAGGMQFGPGEVCVSVPYEERICFIGEEIVHSLRLFDAGYNIYTPINQVVYHLYLRSQNQEKSHHFWIDFTEDDNLKLIYQDMNNTSYRVVREYLSGSAGVGADSIRQFENFAGVDLNTYKVHSDTYRMPSLPVAVEDSWRMSAIKPKKQT